MVRSGAGGEGKTTATRTSSDHAATERMLQSAAGGTLDIDGEWRAQLWRRPALSLHHIIDLRNPPVGNLVDILGGAGRRGVVNVEVEHPTNAIEETNIARAESSHGEPGKKYPATSGFKDRLPRPVFHEIPRVGHHRAVVGVDHTANPFVAPNRLRPIPWDRGRIAVQSSGGSEFDAVIVDRLVSLIAVERLCLSIEYILDESELPSQRRRRRIHDARTGEVDFRAAQHGPLDRGLHNRLGLLRSTLKIGGHVGVELRLGVQGVDMSSISTWRDGRPPPVFSVGAH